MSEKRKLCSLFVECKHWECGETCTYPGTGCWLDDEIARLTKILRQHAVCPRCGNAGPRDLQSGCCIKCGLNLRDVDKQITGRDPPAQIVKRNDIPLQDKPVPEHEMDACRWCKRAGCTRSGLYCPECKKTTHKSRWLMGRGLHWTDEFGTKICPCCGKSIAEDEILIKCDNEIEEKPTPGITSEPRAGSAMPAGSILPPYYDLSLPVPDPHKKSLSLSPSEKKDEKPRIKMPRIKIVGVKRKTHPTIRNNPECPRDPLNCEYCYSEEDCKGCTKWKEKPVHRPANFDKLDKTNNLYSLAKKRIKNQFARQ